MKYSIIIPIYNAEKTIERCLDSLLSQEYKDYEILLVDDGSVDTSSVICHQYVERYSNVHYYFKSNGGASSARNIGLNYAVGEYILFVDSDDYVTPDYFERISSYSLKKGLVVFTFCWMKNNREQISAFPEYLLSSASFYEKTKGLILSRKINSPCAKVFDRDLIETIGLRFDEHMPVAEDFNFCLEYLMKCTEVILQNHSIYFYDVSSENSLVRSRKKGLIDIYPYVFDYAYNTIKASDFTEAEKYYLFRIWDKLHTDSFGTCVMEELKDKEKSAKEIRTEIRAMCVKFYSRYKPDYGYQNAVHFLVRLCIRYKLSFLLYCFGKAYYKLRG